MTKSDALPLIGPYAEAIGTPPFKAARHGGCTPRSTEPLKDTNPAMPHMVLTPRQIAI